VRFPRAPGGYLSKAADGADILRAVREIAAGNRMFRRLSDRERQMLSLVAAGERDTDIADAMSISVRTVRSYLERIRDKTGRRRRPELTRLAIEEGIS
jgi:DNA-binding NarL/FixJ family response regulator